MGNFKYKKHLKLEKITDYHNKITSRSKQLSLLALS